MIKNIIFDVGKVLIGWDPYYTMRVQLGFSEETIKAICSAIFESGVWNEEDRGVKSHEEMFDFLASQDPEYDKEIRLFYANATESVTPKDYSRPWLTALKKAGYKVYVLSNFGEAAFHRAVEIGGINFLDLTDGYIFSYSIKHIKPEPEAYRTLLDRYSLSANECLFIDDSKKNVEGAENVGIHGLVFTGYQNAVKSMEEMGIVLGDSGC